MMKDAEGILIAWNQEREAKKRVGYRSARMYRARQSYTWNSVPHNICVHESSGFEGGGI